MRKIHILIALFLCINNAMAFAQPEISSIKNFPDWQRLYCNHGVKNKDGDTTNLHHFFNEWAEWSKLISKGAPDSQYNAIFTRFFRKYYGKANTMFGGDRDCKYIALPYTIRVEKFNCNIHPDSLSKIHRDVASVLNDRIMPESITYFTPKIELDKPVLYITPKVTDLLDSFIEEPRKAKDYDSITEEDWEESRNRRDMIRDYVPAVIAHIFSEGYYYSSYPLIERIYVGNDGYYVHFSDANYSGEEVFVTSSGKVIEVAFWVQ